VGGDNEIEMFTIFGFKKRKKKVVKKISLQSKKMRKEAREIVLVKVSQFNEYYGFEYKRIFIKDQQTRWGSCSSKGNLNFNYRIVILPPELQDYLIVHELCHLKEMNHGANFWKLVEEQIPNYKVLNKQLRTYSLR
jgi:predicted metal-dependent hydrolase